MVKNSEKNREIGIAKRMKNLTPWKKGDPTPNPKGRGKGVLNYATLRKLAIRKLAKDKGKKAEEIDIEILANALLEARKGNFQFYKDDKDRVYGDESSKETNINISFDPIFNDASNPPPKTA